ncbi:sugar kinase [Marinibacterium profundimaris]|uniref:Sugar kinase n=1 Tax=Marinibacterium profundimaris TaxID=1679460 RepID=A0A225NLD2_9RHOB|nr:sugar kinase [Marinibacterium profundimaris]OWU72871.1 sugar kinase [Marinibacterium profundimaris]
MKKIVIIGEVLVEIMADTTGHGFTAPQPLTGPFPSGAPAIFAAQAACLGQPVGLISAVGDDDFGRVNTDRLAREGVDTSAIFTDPDRPTGSAFVRYRPDGARDFVFNIRHSACGTLHDTPQARALLDSADHLHVMGSSLSGPDFVALNLETARAIRARGGTVSFDPNLRKEILFAPGLAEAMAEMIALTDLFLPSGDELTLLTAASTETEAITELLDRGIRAIVHKNGAAGAAFHDARQSLSASAYPVDEIDPTGAGDCFGATFTTLWLRDTSPARALDLAMASGAIAVTRRGPMEGTSDLDSLDTFASSREPRS